MELYTLDTSLRRTSVIDRFESMIWTERFSAWGDFELHIFSTPEMRRLLPAGTRLAMNKSHRIMTAELIENTTDADGREMLKVTGRSLEAILDERLARNSFANLKDMPTWKLSGTPANIARQIFDAIMRNNTNFPDDHIPFLVPGSLFPTGTIPEPEVEITIELELQSVYKALQDLCQAYDLGFRLVRNYDKSQIFFDIYSGNNRTTKQGSLSPVVFAPNLDNLTNISEVTSIANHRNVVYVFHPLGVQIVTAPNVSPNISGFDRRVLYLDASNYKIDAIDEDPLPILQKLGEAELAKYRPVQAFDGELPMNSPYQYEVSYQLGDLIEMRNDDGIANQMRVTEQIFVSDQQGDRAYPTLAIDRFISAGSWLGWQYNETWSNADGEWAELP